MKKLDAAEVTGVVIGKIIYWSVMVFIAVYIFKKVVL